MFDDESWLVNDLERSFMICSILERIRRKIGLLYIILKRLSGLILLVVALFLFSNQASIFVWGVTIKSVNCFARSRSSILSILKCLGDSFPYL
jgi:hypothetical protein